ncbi:MAG: hypothetical protein ACI837_002573 [Crocinitomicaceae bacterium]|jgi:hypothetical protein
MKPIGSRRLLLYYNLDMIARLLLFTLFTSLLLGCSEEKKFGFKKSKTLHQPFLVNLQHYFSEVEDEVSFPLWFDDSLLKKNKIKTITRKIYALNQDTADVNLPRIQKTYQFTEDGTLLHYEIIEYYERTKVHHVTFSYTGVKDKHGYAVVKFDDENHLLDDDTEYPIYEIEQYASNFLVYQNQTNGNFLFYMTDEKHWGPLSVDSVLHPTPDDFIVLGTPGRPEKRYQVENRVNENNVKEIVYVKRADDVEEIRFENDPFNYKRTIQYDKKGVCTGFVDSTFSIDHFLMKRNSNFELNANHLPFRVVHVSERLKGARENRQLETFEYTYYE